MQAVATGNAPARPAIRLPDALGCSCYGKIVALAAADDRERRRKRPIYQTGYKSWDGLKYQDGLVGWAVANRDVGFFAGFGFAAERAAVLADYSVWTVGFDDEVISR
jgi:hypothetical protein